MGLTGPEGGQCHTSRNQTEKEQGGEGAGKWLRWHRAGGIIMGTGGLSSASM